MLASSLAAILGTAAASSTTYALNGYANQGGLSSPPVPAGVTVDLISRASGAVYTTTVNGSGGAFSFTSGGTGGALAPGYWGLQVPPAANASLSGCKPYNCLVLPTDQNPVYRYQNYTNLTNATHVSAVLQNVTVLPYNATLNGTVTQGGNPVAGASVKLLAPRWNGFVVMSNTTNATGFYNLSVPFGTWVLQVTHSSSTNVFSNSSLVTIVTNKPAPVDLSLHAMAVSGRIYQAGTSPPEYVTTTGNASLYDGTNNYLYTDATPAGGYYSLPAYSAGFSHGNQEFTVVLSPATYAPVRYDVNSSALPLTHDANVSLLQSGERGQYNTTLNFGGLSTTTGRGTVNVTTDVRLGNDSVLGQLPNASIGQLWAQLGLDFNGSLSVPDATVNGSFQKWVGQQGPFFPPAQAGFTVNSTSFIVPKTHQGLTSFASACPKAYCSVWTAGGSISYAWENTYTLNGTIPVNASTYAIAFKFSHPSTSAVTYNYTLELPSGYVLSAGTTAPAQTKLVGKGQTGTWTKFTLESLYSATPSASASLTIVRAANLTANVAVTSTNFTFSSRNILNSTHGHYTVVLGAGMNATFSAAPTTYPAGQNGTSFRWNFGIGAPVTVPNVTTNYTYSAPNGTGPYNCSLNVTSSSNRTDQVSFTVWVVDSTPTAGIAANSTAWENRSAAGTRYLFVNWTTTLQFNATATSLATPNKLSIASYTMKARNYTASANYSASKGANPESNWTVQFGANTTNNTTAPGHGVYVNFATVTIGGHPSGATGWGWIYNLTLTVWSMAGTNATARLTILINDTEPPMPSLKLMTAAGKFITGNSTVEGPHHYAVIRFNATASVDFGNGSIVSYLYYVNNSNSSFKNYTVGPNTTSAKPYPTVQLYPKSTVYKIKMVIADRNGNKANTTVSLSVAPNTTLRPIMGVNNLTGPGTVNAGSSYTYWANITISSGAKATAENVTVSFYLLNPSGTGSRTYIGGAPGGVTFFGYSNNSTNATVNSTPLPAPGGILPSLVHGHRVRALIHWTPSKSGSFTLYARANATNQFDNNSSVSVDQIPLTVHPNPVDQAIEYGAIAAAAIVVLAVIVLLLRRRSRRGSGGSKPSSGRSGLERTAKKTDDDEDDE